MNFKYIIKQAIKFTIISLVLGFLGCNSNDENRVLKSETTLLSNVLNFQGVPENPNDRSVSSFCDLGSWHSFALPSKRDKPYYGGFIGPFSMDRSNGIWLGRKFAHLTLVDENHERINYTKAEMHQYPGHLIQKLSTEIDGLEVVLRLWFHSSKSVIVTSKILNTTKRTIKVYCSWSGETWLDAAEFKNKDDLELIFSDSENKHKYLFNSEFKGVIKSASKTFDYVGEELIEVKSRDYQELSLQYSFGPTDVSGEVLKVLNDENVTSSYNKTVKRWEAYHNAFQYRKNHWLDSTSFELLKSKSIQTLVGNWKTASGELRHDGLFPSYLYNGFHGFWAWDSWKHAVAVARFEPELAKEQMLTMFSYQNEAGMIPDCIFRDTLIEKHNWRDTKPPLATWAVDEIFQQTSDMAFVKLIYPKLIKYHNWWYNNRDHDNNQLCEYGSTDGTRIAAAWESGMDNAVRFDDAIMIKNNKEAWSLNQESVDLNAYLYDEKLRLAKLAHLVGDIAQKEILNRDANLLKNVINEEFFDKDERFYFDRELTNHKAIKVFGPEGWLPIWAGIASKPYAEAVKNRIVDEKLFNTKVPFPTLNVSHEDFDPKDGYWRGPVWLDQAYFAIEGLEKYGYLDVAEALKLKLVKNAEGLLEKGYPIRENYHPITGKGLNANHFSWSAAHLLMLVE